MPPRAPGLLRPGRNCWRVARAHRAAMVVDGAAFFGAARSTLLRARHSVFLLGWNFAEQARLHAGDDGLGWPDEIGDFLRTLVARRPGLRVNVLLWDRAPLLAVGRRSVPGLQRIRMNVPRLRYALDREHPPLTTHHQKLLVVDDAAAFCGGFDFAANRWDTREHAADDARRRMPAGGRYGPNHDVMLAVDGEAARALGDLARDRWRFATGERLAPAPPGAGAWPADLAPDFRDVDVAVARTAPARGGRPEIRECEALFLDAVAAARRSIYVESQYLASPRIGRALAARLAQADGPEIVVVNPWQAPSSIERPAMDSVRSRIVRRLLAADRHGRFRLLAPFNRGRHINVHSKVMVVDDRLLRVGSANLNDRSMGADTECDLAIEARPGAPGEGRVRAAIARLRDDLLAEHLGVPRAEVSGRVADRGTLVGAIDALDGRSARRLAAFPPPRPGLLARVGHNRLTDPARPVPLPGIAGPAARPLRLGLLVAGAALLLALLSRGGAGRRAPAGRRTGRVSAPPRQPPRQPPSSGASNQPPSNHA